MYPYYVEIPVFRIPSYPTFTVPTYVTDTYVTTVYETWPKGQKGLIVLCETKGFELLLNTQAAFCHKKVVWRWFLNSLLETCALEDFTSWMR